MFSEKNQRVGFGPLRSYLLREPQRRRQDDSRARRQRIRIYDDPPLRNSDLSLPGPFPNFGLIRFDMLTVIFSSPHPHEE